MNVLHMTAVSVLASACSAQAPVVTPDQGPTAGGFAVRIEGDDFLGHGSPLVYFGEQPAKAVVIESDRLIRVKSPEVSDEGVVDVAVVYDDGTVFEFPGAFTYVKANVIQLPDQ